MRTRALLILALAAAAQQNPYSLWCDYHSVYFFKVGQEYPSGRCYDVYSHPLGNTTHRATVPCSR